MTNPKSVVIIIIVIIVCIVGYLVAITDPPYRDGSGYSSYLNAIKIQELMDRVSELEKKK